MTNTPNTQFESKTCSRCGGSGHFSFNLMHGTMCYGCQGTGLQYTKRGLAAKEYFRNLMMVPVEELKIGQAIQLFTTDKYFKPITLIEFDEEYNLFTKGLSGYFVGHEKDMLYCVEVQGGGRKAVYPGTLFRIYQTNEEKTAKFQEALRYQDTLGVNGKPKKISKKSKAKLVQH